jgi:hypothetical protein
VSKIKRMRAVLTGVAISALSVASLPVLATATAKAAADPLGGQAGPVTLSPTMNRDSWQPNPPAGTTVDDFMRHPVLSWSAITTLPVTLYRVQVSPNADFTNNAVTLPNGGLTAATQYDLPQTLPHASYFWRVRGEDAAGDATNWTGAAEGDSQSLWAFTKTWADTPGSPTPTSGSAAQGALSWQPIQDASAYEVEISQDQGFPRGQQGIETYDCTTNQTTFSPVEDYPEEPAAASGVVEGSCDDFDTLMKYLIAGSPSPDYPQWYWRVRGIDGTEVPTIAADTGVTCYSDGADCGPWSATQAMTYDPLPSVSATLGTPPTSLATNCPAFLPGGTVPLCYDTPTMSWSQVTGANSYVVETSADPLFSTDYHGYLTSYDSFAPRESFLDNQAGRSYYWRVRGCNTNFETGSTRCTAQSSTANFHKAAPQLPLAPAAAASTPGHDGLYVTTDNNQVLSTAVKTVRGQQMTFHWDDLLAYTKQAGIPSNQEAKEYRLEYTTTGDWLNATVVTVDATHWTKQDGALPDGGYYWRVAPVDGSGNILSWSAAQTVVKGTVAPTVSITQTDPLSPTSVVNLTFAAPVSGVSTATLGLREVGGGTIPGTIVWPAPSPTSATFTPAKPLSPGERVIPWVSSSVVDLAGNAAKASTVSSLVDPTIDSVSSTISELWSKVSASKASGHSYAKAAGARDTISFTVTGGSLALYGIRTPDGGYGLVSIDGVAKKTVNFFGKKTTYGAVLYKAALKKGSHVVTVTVKGSHPKGSKGNAVNVDALKVDGKMVQQSSAVQAWSRHRSTDAFQGSYDAESSYLASWHASKPTLQATFAGTAVHLVGCKSPDAGNFAVYVDGKLKAKVSGYQKYTSCNKTLVRLKGLSNRHHTITVASLGTKAKAAKGTKVSVDAIVAG